MEPILDGGYLKGALLGAALALISNIRIGPKDLSDTNTLAYFASSSVAKKKSLITLNYVINVVKLFFFITDDETE